MTSSYDIFSRQLLWRVNSAVFSLYRSEVMQIRNGLTSTKQRSPWFAVLRTTSSLLDIWANAIVRRIAVKHWPLLGCRNSPHLMCRHHPMHALRAQLKVDGLVGSWPLSHYRYSSLGVNSACQAIWKIYVFAVCHSRLSSLNRKTLL